MKRFIISISIMFAMLLFVACWMYSLSEIKEKLLSITKEASQAALDNDIELATAKYEELKSTWEDDEDLMITLVRHEHVDQISISVAKLSMILSKDNLSEFIGECYVIEEATEHLWRSELPTSVNLF